MNILVCDNDPGILRSLEILLNRIAGQVRCFCDPMDTLQYLQKHPGEFHLLIADYFMPVMNGLDLIRESRPYLSADSHVMLITGHLDRLPDPERARREADTLLQKPFCLESFRTILDSWPVEPTHSP